MFKKQTEEDFKQLYYSSYLSPDTMVGLLWSTLIFSGIMFMVLSLGVSENYNLYGSEELWKSFLSFEGFSLLILLILAIFFTIEIFTYKFQKFLSFITIFATFKLMIAFFPIIFLLYDDRDLPIYVFYITIAIIGGGILSLIISSIVFIIRIKKGELRKGGELFNFYSKSTKIYTIISLVYVIGLLLSTIIAIFINEPMYSGHIIEYSMGLFVASVLFYALSMIWIQYPIMFYCKMRFPSFHEDVPKRKNHKHNNSSNRQTMKEYIEDKKVNFRNSFQFLWLLISLLLFVVFCIYQSIGLIVEKVYIEDLLAFDLLLVLFFINISLSLILSAIIYPIIKKFKNK